MRNSLVRKASVRPKQLSARLPVFRNVRGSSADEVLGHFPFVAALVGELQGERTVHISAGWVAGDQGAAMSAVRARYIATARALLPTCARARACVAAKSAHARVTIHTRAATHTRRPERSTRSAKGVIKVPRVW